MRKVHFLQEEENPKCNPKYKFPCQSGTLENLLPLSVKFLYFLLFFGFVLDPPLLPDVYVRDAGQDEFFSL